MSTIHLHQTTVLERAFVNVGGVSLAAAVLSLGVGLIRAARRMER
jgi:hypothetical protein